MELAQKIMEKLEDYKLTDIKLYPFDKVMGEIDYLIVASADNKKLVSASAESLYDDFRHQGYNVSLRNSKDSNWLVVNFTNIVVHIFLDSERAYYQVDELWSKL